MEREFYTDEFEQLLKEKSDQFRMYPSKRVWHSIYNDLHPSRRWPSAAISIFLITTLMFIGYLNTGDNKVNSRFNETNTDQISNKTDNNQSNKTTKHNYKTNANQHFAVNSTGKIYRDFNLSESEFLAYTIVKNNRPNYLFSSVTSNASEVNNIDKKVTDNGSKDLIQTMNTYIKSNQIYADLAATRKKAKDLNTIANNKSVDIYNRDKESVSTKTTVPTTAVVKPASTDLNSNDLNKTISNEEKSVVKNKLNAEVKSLTPEEKAWIENFTLQNKPSQNKWKGRLAVDIYATPAVNYRKLSTNSKGSATPFANSDINNSISQKPGLGIETGIGLNYAFAKKLQLKAGIQFNYTNYNIDADQTNHPILTSILLNDPNTGFSYSAARTSSISNSYNSAALQPVTLHNRTYQISIPVGFAYKLSSHNNVDWFTGASIQPTYVFGGKANLISSDLKSYVSDPSSIRNWNLSMGFETYMNFKLSGYNLQIGPQVRYQFYSTYNKKVALIEKPYAVGLKVGLIKVF